MKNFISFFLLLLTMLSSSCKEDEPNFEDIDKGSSVYINDWIYTNMNFYYLWNNEMPSKRTTGDPPDEFFYSLLSDQDRFSWIQPNFQELLNSLQGVNLESGYEFVLYAGKDNSVYGQISYVKKDSPAQDAGLLRGDLFTEINGAAMAIDNYVDLLGNINENHSISVQRYNFESQQFEDLGVVELNAIQFAENPNFLDTVYTRNGKKIGYYVYNLFSTGIGNNSDSAKYNEEMDAIFAEFKSEGINHLVLDLRYNSGGAESATLNLASLIGANITNQDIFVKRAYNGGLTRALIDQYGEESLVRRFLSKSSNIGNSLQSPQLIVLTSSRTASASESLINGLNPYMDTFIIGDTTVGKNVGSTSFYEPDNPENTWGIQPIITKTYNSLDQSDYDLGFYPDIVLLDRDSIKYPLGDINEKLLREALIYVAGSDENSRYLSNTKPGGRYLLGSMELKRNYGVYNISLEK
ncbi:S41 family peptidase [Marivirga sp.]|uniref:S41 family peptidase n=1 Tax=Marivirga sp. TaxID=2018662 RepID=UPI002D7F4DBB|nr:S41 family peptidase [Marivirga sp.]HET8859757.1 S41 family peptidase [Marivirga sp.]